MDVPLSLTAVTPARRHLTEKEIEGLVSADTTTVASADPGDLPALIRASFHYGQSPHVLAGQVHLEGPHGRIPYMHATPVRTATTPMKMYNHGMGGSSGIACTSVSLYIG